MTEKRFTDVWCSETGQIGITDNGIDRTFTGSEFNDFLNSLVDENKQLKKVAEEFTQNPTQHNLWKLRTVLKDSDIE